MNDFPEEKKLVRSLMRHAPTLSVEIAKEYTSLCCASAGKAQKPQKKQLFFG